MATSLLLPAPQPATSGGAASAAAASLAQKEPPQPVEDEHVAQIETEAARRAARVSLRGVNYPLCRELGLAKEEAERVVDALVGIQGDLATVASEELDPVRGRAASLGAAIRETARERDDHERARCRPRG